MNRRAVFVVAVAAVAGLLFLRGGESDVWKLANARIGGGPIVCFGDSLTSGFGADAHESYPAVLGELLGREVVNRGRNGETAASALERLDEDVLSLEPAAVIVTLGGNDILRRVPVEETVASMREIFRRVLATGAPVVFLGIDPPFAGSERMDAIRELCRELGVLWVGNVMRGLWGDSSRMADRIHPNAAGYRVVAGRVAEALRERRLTAGG